MGILPTLIMWFFMAAVVVLSVDSLAMGWVEKGQPDPFRNLDRVSLARRRNEDQACVAALGSQAPFINAGGGTVVHRRLPGSAAGRQGATRDRPPSPVAG